MSNHRTSKAIMLHHRQADVAMDRRRQHQMERAAAFHDMSQQHYYENIFTLWAGFLCFAYMGFGSATYLWYVLKWA